MPASNSVSTTPISAAPNGPKEICNVLNTLCYFFLNFDDTHRSWGPGPASENTSIEVATGVPSAVTGALDGDDSTYNRQLGNCGGLSGMGTNVFWLSLGRSSLALLWINTARWARDCVRPPPRDLRRPRRAGYPTANAASDPGSST